jgi:hypothetical protein
MPFHKGESRTPAGRPRGARNRATLLHAGMAIQTAGCRNERAIVSRLFFTMKIPTLTCGGADDVDVARIERSENGDFPSRHDEDELNTLRWQLLLADKLSQCRTRMSLRSIRATRLPKPLLNRVIACSTYRATHATAQPGSSESPQPRPSPPHALQRLLPLANNGAQGEWSALPEYII